MTDHDPDLAVAAALDAEPSADDIKAWVERERGASLQAFALDFRKQIGRPFDDHEWLLVQMAHSAGWHDGLDAGLRGELEPLATPVEDTP